RLTLFPYTTLFRSSGKGTFCRDSALHGGKRGKFLLYLFNTICGHGCPRGCDRRTFRNGDAVFHAGVTPGHAPGTADAECFLGCYRARFGDGTGRRGVICHFALGSRASSAPLAYATYGIA